MKLVIFDVDGTLVDSQHHIHQAMNMAFESADLPPPPLPEILATVGLSLPVAFARLAADQDAAMQARLVDGYKDVFNQARIAEDAPLYPGALDCLNGLSARDDLLLAVATGKSMRGLLAMIDAHGLHGKFVTLQTADQNPSKPDPAMVLAALAAAGVEAADAVMVGDTSFDIEMGVSAGVTAFGVGWGYHPAESLRRSGAHLVAPDFDALTAAIREWVA